MSDTDRTAFQASIAAFVGAGGTGLCVSLAAWSYSAAMDGDMIFAAVLAFLSWLTAAAALVVTNEYGYLKFADDYQTKGKILFIAFLFGLFLFGWEYNHRPAQPLTAAEIAHEVIASLPPFPSENRSTVFADQKYSGALYADNPDDIKDYHLNVGSKMEIGNSGSIFAFTGLEGQPMFNIFNKSELKIKTKDERVLVSTRVFSANGRLVAEIIDNEWKSAPSPVTWDRNYSKDAFEVKNADGDIVLQVRVLADRVQIQGKWYDEKGNGFGLVSLGRDKGAEILIKGSRVDPLSTTQIRPIFIYPSSDHLGQKTVSQD